RAANSRAPPGIRSTARESAADQGVHHRRASVLPTDPRPSRAMAHATRRQGVLRIPSSGDRPAVLGYADTALAEAATSPAPVAASGDAEDAKRRRRHADRGEEHALRRTSP